MVSLNLCPAPVFPWIFLKFQLKQLKVLLEKATFENLEKSIYTFLTLFRMGIFGAARGLGTAQKTSFSIKGFFSKCDKIRRNLWIWSHLLKKSLMENFIFSEVRGKMAPSLKFVTHILQ